MKTEHQALNSTAPHSSASPQPTLEKLGVGGVGESEFLLWQALPPGLSQQHKAKCPPLQFLQTLGALS